MEWQTILTISDILIMTYFCIVTIQQLSSHYQIGRSSTSYPVTLSCPDDIIAFDITAYEKTLQLSHL